MTSSCSHCWQPLAAPTVNSAVLRNLMKQRAGIANKPNHLKWGQTPHLSDTTFVPVPVSDDGTIDCAAAINQRNRAEIKREENAAVWIIRTLGSNVPEFKCEPNLFEELGMQRPPVHGDYLQPEHPKPAYLKQIPADIFTDKPLLYQHIDEGYQLYSVGPNRKDDTGRTHLWPDPGDDPPSAWS